jgi:N-acetylglucosaminyldiphosphoundecaprenol N-acetyl-beta-D-mannosaminyltransferase
MSGFAIIPYLGLPVADLDAAEAADVIAARPAGAPFAYVVTPNPQHYVRMADGDQDFLRAYAGAWLQLNDSQGMRLAARALFGMTLKMAPGSDVTAQLFRRHIRPGDAITILGGTAEVETRLRAQFGLNTIHRHDPPMGFIRDPKAVAACVDFIVAHPARFVFLAVGAPQSEKVAVAVAERGTATGTGLCIGSSLHFLTGVVPRAPLWMRQFALEWLFRLGRDPRRHARRVFVESLPFFWLAAKRRFGGGDPHRPLGA